MSYSLIIWAFLFNFAGLFAHTAYGFTIIGVSNFEDCTNSEADGLECAKKTTVAINLDTEEVDGSSVISFAGDGEESELANPVTLTISKPRPFVQYRTQYAKGSVLNRPYERDPYYFEGGIGKEKCESFGENRFCPGDDGMAGICCNCDSYPNEYLLRPGIQCGSSKYHSAAHCTQSDNLFYNVYTVHEHKIYYEVTVSLSYKDIETGELVVDSLKIGTDKLGDFLDVPVLGKNNELSARITDHGSNNNPSLSNYSFLVAIFDGVLPPHEQVAAGPDRYLLLENLHIDLSGGNCNKIGAHHGSFTQLARCTDSHGSCFKNQIYDFYKKDEENIQNNAPLQYYVRRNHAGLGDYLGHEQVEVGAPGDSTKYAVLKFLQTESHTPTLVLKLKADRLRLVANKGTATFVSATVAPFEAQSGTGRLKVVILNTGSLAADFYIAFGDRSTEILSTLEAQKLAVLGNTEAEYEWTVDVTYILDNIYFLTLILQDATFNELATERIEFTVHGTVIVIDPGAGGRPDPNDSNSKDDESSSNWVDKILNVLKYVGIALGGLLAAGALGLLLLKLATLCGIGGGVSPFLLCLQLLKAVLCCPCHLLKACFLANNAPPKRNKKKLDKPDNSMAAEKKWRQDDHCYDSKPDYPYVPKPKYYPVLPSYPTNNHAMSQPMSQPMSQETLVDCVKFHSAVYFNMENVDQAALSSIVYNPPPMFSLIGYVCIHELSSISGRMEDKGVAVFSFDIQTHKHQCVHYLHNQYAQLPVPMVLDAPQFVQLLTLPQAIAHLTTSPRYPAINN